ncbi:DWNN domain-containing protein [Lipomyces arxii]|uniref:DWNN domain-containing protein n=1 Tax=Lipomyces arxii TaxID=56418 RepID=UPI0034CE642B
MSSFIYYKFRSQRDPLRIAFDGTGLTVFDLKREVILVNKLGEGTDFDLCAYNVDTNEEYEDDSEVLPRSTSVVIRRRAPSKPGRGTGARYASGKSQPIAAIPSGAARRAPGHEQNLMDTVGSGTGIPHKNGNSEDDMINAMFQAQNENWRHTQEHMAGATPVYRGSGQRQRAPAPDYPPPPTYVCYRCGLKGHWIQNCPTNNDPNWEHRRIKRTTGIPKSFLKTVNKEEVDVNEASGANVRVNENGEYVVVQPDSATWQSYLQRQRNDAATDGDDGQDDNDRRRKRPKRQEA